jgi:membrane peptidoglycan carboxypeptidase
LAVAFRQGDFTLETLVPDEPISVPNGNADIRKWISNYDGGFKGLMPIREALAESRNAVAIWITEQIGIDAVMRTSRSIGVQTPLQPVGTARNGCALVDTSIVGPRVMLVAWNVDNRFGSLEARSA